MTLAKRLRSLREVHRSRCRGIGLLSPSSIKCCLSGLLIAVLVLLLARMGLAYLLLREGSM